MERSMNELSRVLSHALRHEPWLYEIEIDDDGWVSIECILPGLRRLRPEWATLSEDDLRQVVEASSKTRHEIRKGEIRALYGHSLAGKIRRLVSAPPTILYHGTSADAKTSIQKIGLIPLGRQYVHLSIDKATAMEVGRRKTREPIIFRILALNAYSRGVLFYEGNDKVWLANEVPPNYISIETK